MLSILGMLIAFHLGCGQPPQCEDQAGGLCTTSGQETTPSADGSTNLAENAGTDTSTTTGESSEDKEKSTSGETVTTTDGGSGEHSEEQDEVVSEGVDGSDGSEHEESCDDPDQDCRDDAKIPPHNGVFPPGTTDVQPEQPLTGDQYETKAKAKMDAGPFGMIDVTGTVKKAGKDSPVTWCFKGTGSLQNAPFQLTGVEITLCKDEQGNITRTVTGTLTLDGETSTFTGSFTVGNRPSLTMQTPSLKILGISTTDAEISWTQGGTFVTVKNAKGQLVYLSQTLDITLSGQLDPGKDSSLDITVSLPSQVNTVGGIVGVKAQSITGQRLRHNQTLSSELTLSTTNLKLPTITTKTWQVEAKQEDGKLWQLSILAKDSEVLPFDNLQLQGNFVEKETTACISGPTGAKEPETGQDIIVKLCWGQGKGSAAEYSVKATDPQLGDISLQGTYDTQTKTLCLKGTMATGLSLGGKTSTVDVSTCWDAQARSFGAFSYQANVDISGHGQSQLQGTSTKLGSTTLLCLAGDLKTSSSPWFPLKGVTILAVKGKSCLQGGGFPEFRLQYTYRIGSNSAVTAPVLESEVRISPTSGVCLTSDTSQNDCDKANKTWLQSVLDPRSKMDPRYVWLGGACIDSYSKTATSCQSGTWQGGNSLSAGMTLAAFCQKKGSTTCEWSASCDTAQGDSSCQQSWKPFDQMPIGAPYDIRTALFGNLTGSLWVHNQSAHMRLRGEVTSTLPDGKIKIVVENGQTLFALTQPGVLGVLDSQGTWDTQISGRADVNMTGQNMAPWKIEAVLEGQVKATTIQFSGVLLPSSCDLGKKTCDWPEVEPFASVIGKGAFKMSGKDGTLDVSAPYSTSKAEHFQVNVVSWSETTIPGNNSVQNEVHVQSLWKRSEKGNLATIPAVTFAVSIGQQRMAAGNFTLELGKVKVQGGGFRTLPTYLLLSSESVTGFPIDLDGDPKNGKETLWDISTGVTIRTTMELPHIANIFKDVVAKVDISWTGTKFSLRGELDFNWTLIKPSYGIPTLESAVFDKVFAEFNFPGTIRIFIGGKVKFVTIDRDGKKNNLEGLAQFEADGKGGMGGTVALSGLWKNPLWLPNVAIFNAGISMKMNPAFPLGPSALGFTGQGLLLKGAMDTPWPEIQGNSFNNPVGVNPDKTLMNKLPDNVTTTGFTFYYDIVPAKSDFCYNFCKLPPLLFRIDQQNIGTDDIIGLSNLILGGLQRLVKESQTISVLDIKTGQLVQVQSPWAPLVQALPLNQSFKPISISPFSLKLDRLQVYMSTHNQERFNVNWPNGFRLWMDARFTPGSGPDKGQEKLVKLRGHLDIWGIKLRGSMSAIQLLPGLKLTGDPYRRLAKIGNGSLNIPTKKGHWDWGTFEGWFRDDTIAGGSSAAILYRRMTSSSGIQIATDELAPACVPGAIDLDGNPLDCTTGRGRIVVTLKTNSTTVPSAERTRIVKTQYGVLMPQQLHHVAVTRDPQTHEIRIYIDGAPVPVLDSADGQDGEPNTSDDLARFALPDATAIMTIGERFDYVDDVRLWKTVRTQGEIERSIKSLEKGFHLDADLIARWEVDYDRTLDTNATGIILHNSKLGGDSLLDGNYANGAAPEIDANNQDLGFTLLYPLLNPFNSGWAIRAGLDLKLPQSILTLSGNPNGITVAADLSYLPGAIGGRLYARELTVVPIPGIGGFVITGDGPNNKSGDFDDGLYMEGEFRTPKNIANPTGDQLPVFDASGAFALDWNGTRHPIVTAAMRIGCLEKNAQGEGIFSSKECAFGSGYHVWAKALLGKSGSFEVDLGGGFGNLGITGIFTLSTLDAPVKLVVDGNLKVFSKDLTSIKIYVDGTGIQASSRLDLGVQHGVNLGVAQKLDIQFTWKPVRFCASGQTIVAIPVLANFDGQVDVCLGSNPSASFVGKASSGSFGGTPVTDIEVSLSSSQGLQITKARLKVGPIFDSNITGWYKSSSNFSLTGTAKMTPGSGKILRLDTSTTVSNSGVSHSTSLDTSGTGNWVSGSIQGASQWKSGTPYWALAGNATLKPSGLNLLNSRFWICDPWSTTDPAVPTDCRNNSGFGGLGELDLKVVKMGVGLKVNDTVTDYAVSGSASFRWKMGGFLYTWVEEIVKEVAKAISGWDCDSYCEEKVAGQCVLYWFRCRKKETHSQTEQVEADVTFTLTGSSQGVQLKATATLKVGRWGGSSTSSCTLGAKPECCFSFVSPIGNQCLKLY